MSGTWDLTTEDENCFERMIFRDGLPSYKPISLSFVQGNHTTEYMGSHSMESGNITIEIDNFSSIEPFDMSYEQKSDVLNVSYAWDNEDNHCSYTLRQE